jgi:hypothetical protein
VDLVGEQVPKNTSEHKSDRHPDDSSDGYRNARLPGDRRAQPTLGETDPFQQREVPAAASNRGDRCKSERHDGAAGEPPAEDCGRRSH